MKFRLITLSLFIAEFLFAQNHQSRFETIDVQHYIFEIHLSDTTNRIEGKTNIQVKFLKDTKNINLDFVGLNDSASTGMKVKTVVVDESEANYNHSGDQLDIQFSGGVKAGETRNIGVIYSGIPADGLIISENKFGERTFFSDNWPNRARFWLPTVDHPSDKATLEFLVFAPEHYKVVANGSLENEIELGNGINFTQWRENVPISTKLMVIGVAKFSVNNLGTYNKIPVTYWVYPKDSTKAIQDFAAGIRPLSYFADIIGPYPYEKLAHVQSTIRYGGMENASCIFYAEQAVTGQQRMESLIAHETAHQWFGNSVTEQNWHHLWLSEGFATYLTHLYEKYVAGEEVFRKGLINDRNRVIAFNERKQAPIIDTTITDYVELLNPNSYEKAGWVLHMLRNKIGDELFVQTLNEYYWNFRDSTALTLDFQKTAERVSGVLLDDFFHQWLWQSGFPELKWNWKQKRNGEIILKIKQVQKSFLFQFPMDFKFLLENGESRIRTVPVNEKKTKVVFTSGKKVKGIEADPDVNLLFEEKQ